MLKFHDDKHVTKRLCKSLHIDTYPRINTFPRGVYPILRKGSFLGFTLVELLISIAIIGTLAGITGPLAVTYIDRAHITRGIEEIRLLEKEITVYQLEHGTPPPDLNAIGRGGLLDPWGTPYQYLKIAGAPVDMSKVRKDRFLVPVNSDYDLYSMGKNKKSKPPFNSPDGRDDIVRANDGGYVGLASLF
ncbi:MAG: prepilin-type N-terminal cleavage/methylation domain-containing protein [Pseudomonadota bacterium]